MNEFNVHNLKIFNADCMDIMFLYPDDYFDLAITDPPYFNGPEKLGYYRNGESKVSRVKGWASGGYWVKGGYKEIGEWKVPSNDYFEELIRVSKEQIIWGINYYPIANLGNGRIIWDKVNGTSTFSDCEIAYCSKINSVRMFSFMWNGMMQGSSKDGKRAEGNKKIQEVRIHPTQKPVQLYKWLYKKFSKSGQKILDTHLGSGSNAIAAHYAKVSEFVGCELDTDYFQLAIERIEKETRQLELEL